MQGMVHPCCNNIDKRACTQDRDEICGRHGQANNFAAFKPIFFKYLYNTIFLIYSSDFSVPLKCWRLRHLCGWLGS
jgi:hypothetical protein